MIIYKNIRSHELTRYYQLPQAFFSQANYRDMSMNAKVLYSALANRCDLSRHNGWVDEDKNIYLMYSQEELAELLGMSVSTVSRAMNDLIQHELLAVKRQGLGQPNRLYVGVVQEVKQDEDIVTAELEDRMYDSSCRSMDDVDEYAGASPDPSNLQVRNVKMKIQDLHVCKSDLSPVQARPVTSANQDLSPVQANKTNINKPDLESLIERTPDRDGEDGGDVRARMAMDRDPALGRVTAAYLENIQRQAGPIVLEELRDLYDTFGEELLTAAITAAARRGATGISYVSKVVASLAAQAEGAADARAKPVRAAERITARPNCGAGGKKAFRSGSGYVKALNPQVAMMRDLLTNIEVTDDA